MALSVNIFDTKAGPVMMGQKPNEVMVYGIIGVDVTGQQIAAQLAAIGADNDVLVRINSRGGDVFDGVAILNALRSHAGKVTVAVDGLAASAASFIAMAGDEIVMNRNSEIMIHNGHSMALGGAEDMRKMADRLEATNANIASIYAERAGGTPDAWRTVMAAETWFSAEEAVKAGLADRVEAIKDRDADKIKAHFDLTIFNHAGRQAAPAPQIAPQPTETPSAAEAEDQKKEEGQPMATLQEGLAQKLGIPADADDETVLAALDEALADKSTAEVEPVEPSIEQATQVAAKAGLTLVSNEALVSLQSQAREGAEARAQQVRESDERIVDSAILNGKVTPASRDHWLTQLNADRVGITNVIAGLPAVIPVNEVGHGVTNEITNEDDALYASLFGASAGKDV